VITHMIELSRHKQFKKWVKEIGFKHPKNIKKVNFLKENGKF